MIKRAARHGLNLFQRLNHLGLVHAESLEQTERLGLGLGTYRKLLDHAAIRWQVHWDYLELDPDKCHVRRNAWDGNLLTTVGAGDLWTGLTTAGLSVPFSTTNAMLAVGDGNTAAAVGNTDLAAAAGTKLNAADPTAVTQTGATAIIVTATYSPTPSVGDAVVCSSFAGASAADINDTWELSAASSAAITLLNSYVSSATITFSGALVKPINKYRVAASSVTPSSNQVVFVGTFPANSANFAANEWQICTGGAASGVPNANAANLQHAPPPHVLDRVVASNGTKARGNTGVLTATLSLA